MRRNIALPLAFLICLTIGHAARADVPGFSDGGGTIVDNGSVTSTIQITADQIIQDARFTVQGLNHTWAGDLVITVSHSTSGKSATLLHRIGTTSNPDSTGDSSDFNGTYSFQDGNPSIWTSAANGDTDFVIPGGNYDASGPNESVVSLNGIFAGETTQGTWTFTIRDENETQDGSFERTEVYFVSVPEPASSVAVLLGLAAAMSFRRRNGNPG